MHDHYIPKASGHDNCTEGTVRLVNSTTEFEGRVEMCLDGVGNSMWSGL